MHTKDFEGWSKVKQHINAKANTRIFREREIWWCSIGVNIGDEEDGKNQSYNRPVLILKKFNDRLFWGVPTTTKVKDNKFYFPIEFKGKQVCAMLSHLRLYDSKRLENRDGRLPETQFFALVRRLKDIMEILLPLQ